MRIGRAISVGLLGLLFMLFVSMDLVLFGVVALNSAIVTILPLVGLVLGIVLGAMAGRRQAARGGDPGPAALADS